MSSLVFSTAVAQTPVSLRGAIALGRERAPQVRVAAALVAEAKAAVGIADVWAQANPELEAVAGPSFGGDGGIGAEVTLAVPFERGGKRAANVAVAQAEVRRQAHAADDSARLAASAAAEAWLRVLHGERRVTLALDRLTVATELRRTAIERQRAGDVARFEVNLAEGELARAEGEVAGLQAQLAGAAGALSVALGLPAGATAAVAGDLADHSPFQTALAATVPLADRADLRVARSEVEAATAETRAAAAARRPDVGLLLRYGRDAVSDSIQGGLSLPIPLFQNGRGSEARAQARGKRAAVELAVLEQAVLAEIAAAKATYDAALRAAQAIGDGGVDRARENEVLARESFRAGKIDLQSVLLIRRDALDLRRDHLDRQLDAALAAVRLWQARGCP